MSEPLLPKRFLFRFSVPCRYRTPLWSSEIDSLDAAYRLASIAELEDAARSADFRMAWSEEGLAFAAHVTGKQQPPWCRASRPEDSDGVQLWLDTRDVHSVHRAGRFCHRFFFMPVGGGNRLDQPVVQWLPINRAKEHPKAIKPGQIQTRIAKRADGYLLEGFLPAEALTGFDPHEYPRLGFTYAILDRELGEQTFAAGSPMPYQEDPSQWATLELVC
jgi:hypothetical protein